MRARRSPQAEPRASLMLTAAGNDCTARETKECPLERRHGHAGDAAPGNESSCLSRRWRRTGRADAGVRLAGDTARRAGDLAAEPEDGAADHADLAPADLDRLGRGADLLLQRPLQVDHRRQAPLGARPTDARGVARDLGRDRPDARHRARRRSGHLRRSRSS